MFYSILKGTDKENLPLRNKGKLKPSRFLRDLPRRKDVMLHLNRDETIPTVF